MLLFVFQGRLKFKRSDRIYLTAAGLAGAVIIMAGFFLIIYDGIEPLSFGQGVSLWPSEGLRLLAFTVGVAFIIMSRKMLKTQQKEVQKDFGLSPEPQKRWSLSQYLDNIGAIFTHSAQPKTHYILGEDQAIAVQKYLQEGREYENALLRLETAGDLWITEERPKPKRVSIDLLWRHYLEQSGVFKRSARAIIMTFFYFGGCLALVPALGKPAVPTRGDLSEVLDAAVTSAAILIMFYIIFWVVDSTRSVWRVVDKLANEETTLWPENLKPEEFKPLRQTYEKSLSYYYDVSFIGRLTDTTIHLIYFPFILLTLLFIARSPYFANWQWTPFVVGIYFANVVICVFCAFTLRFKAVRAKDKAIAGLDQTIIAIAADGRPEIQRGLGALEKLRRKMETNEEGAFLPWQKQPVISAILIPLSGTGGFQIMAYLLSHN